MTTCGCVDRTAIVELLNLYATCIHLGSGDRARLTPYEAIGTYHDEHVRTAGGWRISSRHFDVRISIGDIRVLHPG